MLKVCYTIRDNLGDSINPLIFSNVFNCDILHSDEFRCDMSGIGSGLRRFFIDDRGIVAKKKLIEGLFHLKKAILFSSGFLSTPKGTEKPLRHNMEVVSVRGELSKEWVSKLLHKQVDCGTGDAGLLACYLLKGEDIPKKYDVGIIPHDKERQEHYYFELQKQIPNSVVIDVRGDVLTILRVIASCRTIISSSLHGLIIADSFLIPYLHVKLTNKLSGYGFKFKDYYSCFGLRDCCIDFNEFSNISMDYIAENYRLTKELIQSKQQEIFFDFEKIKRIKHVRTKKYEEQ